jgi:hypothetical protein
MKTYPIYLQHEESNREIKVISENSVYEAQVLGLKNGSFFHGRSFMVFPFYCFRQKKYVTYDEYVSGEFKRSDEHGYVTMLKNYWEIDKTLRNIFHSKYGFIDNTNNQSF